MFFIVLIGATGLGLGLAAALITGSTLQEIVERLRRLRIAHWPVFALGAALSVAVGLDANMLAARFALGISLALLLAGCLLNRHLVGTRIVAVGLAANLIVLLTNGYLPVSEGAVIAAGIVDADGLDRVLLGAARRWSGDATVAAFLGGTIPLAPLRDVITLGDLVTAVGFANVAFRLMWPADFAVSVIKAIPEQGSNATEAPPHAMHQNTLENPALAGVADATGSEQSQPTWATRVEPAPWPVPAPWPTETQDVPVAPAAGADEPVGASEQQLFTA